MPLEKMSSRHNYSDWTTEKLVRELGKRDIPSLSSYEKEDLVAILSSTDLLDGKFLDSKKTGKSDVLATVESILYENELISVDTFYSQVRTYDDLLAIQKLGLSGLIENYVIGGISTLRDGDFTYLASKEKYAYYLRSLRNLAHDTSIFFDNLVEVDSNNVNDHKPYLSGWIREEDIDKLQSRLSPDIFWNFYLFPDQKEETNTTSSNDRYVARSRQNGKWTLEGEVLGNTSYFYEQTCFFARSGHLPVTALLLTGAYFVLSASHFGKVTTMDFLKSLLWNGSNLSPRRQPSTKNKSKDNSSDEEKVSKLKSRGRKSSSDDEEKVIKSKSRSKAIPVDSSDSDTPRNFSDDDKTVSDEDSPPPKKAVVKKAAAKRVRKK